jgi:hypothetical protein
MSNELNDADGDPLDDGRRERTLDAARTASPAFEVSGALATTSG